MNQIFIFSTQVHLGSWLRRSNSK